jgi:DNA-directed RNA polymerase subunit RPC12/RpoP
MVPTGKGPYPAEKFLDEEGQAELGVQKSDLLPGLFCPQCSSLILFPPGTDIGRPIGSGNEVEYRCECGFRGIPQLDFETREHNCPSCGLVVSTQLADDSPSRLSDE